MIVASVSADIDVALREEQPVEADALILIPENRHLADE
jgi:hypothetical protein